jgi:hypothetical protein
MIKFLRSSLATERRAHKETHVAARAPRLLDAILSCKPASCMPTRHFDAHQPARATIHLKFLFFLHPRHQ